MVPPENVIENDGMAGRNTDNLAEGIYDKIQIPVSYTHLNRNKINTIFIRRV